jgi:hypothetical protein
MALTSPLPVESTLDTTSSDGKRTGYISEDWSNWLRNLMARVDTTPQRQAKATRLQTQGAAIATTALALGTLQAGLYRVSYRTRVTRAATTSSSLTVTLSWTDAGIPCSQSGVAMAGNTLGTQQNGTLLIRIDPSTGISFATAYATVGATPMQYELEIVVEAVPA